MLQNARVTAFTVFWVIEGKPTEGVKLPLSPPRFGLKYGLVVEDLHLICCYTAAIID